MEGPCGRYQTVLNLVVEVAGFVLVGRKNEEVGDRIEGSVVRAR